MNFRKTLILFVFLALGSACLFGQFSANPNDVMYGDLKLWEGKGIIHQLPVLRPYPPQVIREYLAVVAEKGDAADSAKAKAYLKEINQKFNFHAEVGGEARTTKKQHYEDGYGMIQAGGWVNDKIHIEGFLKGILMDETNGEVLPDGRRTDIDIFDTWADATVKNRKISARQSQNVMFAAGDTDLYFQAGIVRNSFGPFWGDSVVLSADAPHAGHYSAVYRNSWFSYSNVLLELAATNSLSLTADNDNKFPDKHLILQAFNFYVTDWLELGFFESIIWGGRLDLSYLLPAKELFYAQSMAGFKDNSFMGVMADIRIAKNWKIPVVAYVDDLNLSDVASFQFGTKYKVAGQTGVQWTPDGKGILKRLSLEYVAVTPYTYTHKPADLDGLTTAQQNAILAEPNYLNYTHMGTNLGIGMEPNSDRTTLEALLAPVNNLNLTLTARLQRHGNASSAMVSPTSRNDGSILDDGYNSLGDASFHYKTNFLSQAVLETVAQAGFQVEYSIPVGIMTALIKGGYTFQHTWNKDLVRDESETLHFANFGLGFRY